MAGRTRIGQFLKTRKSTQKDAAQELGVTVATFSNKANGYTEFKQSEIKKLADMYDMSNAEIRNVFF